MILAAGDSGVLQGWLTLVLAGITTLGLAFAWLYKALNSRNNTDLIDELRDRVKDAEANLEQQRKDAEADLERMRDELRAERLAREDDNRRHRQELSDLQTEIRNLMMRGNH